MIKGFEFVHDGKTFSCCVEAPLKSRPEKWWWFRVSTDDRHRYAPFEAAASDTRANVEKRILAYYASLLAARARPAATPWRRPAVTPTVPAAAIVATLGTTAAAVVSAAPAAIEAAAVAE
jgi:hypothetical protein